MQNVGIWAIAQLRDAVPDFKYGVFRLPTPAGGKYVTVGGGWAMVANAKGKNPDAAGKFCAWALGSMSPDSMARVVDWCTKAKSDMPPRQSALEGGKACLRQGQSRALRQRDLSRHPRRAAPAAAGLQDHLRRHPGLPAQWPGSCRSPSDGHRRQQAARRVPRHVQGRADALRWPSPGSAAGRATLSRKRARGRGGKGRTANLPPPCGVRQRKARRKRAGG